MDPFQTKRRETIKIDEMIETELSKKKHVRLERDFQACSFYSSFLKDVHLQITIITILNKLTVYHFMFKKSFFSGLRMMQTIINPGAIVIGKIYFNVKDLVDLSN